jgi:decaprenylphospho-beta-D-erythro-pentofuranosid-2-ulose 2-reductase
MSNNEAEPIRPLVDQNYAIIVGASSGIGAALANLLAVRGYHLGLVARRADLLSELTTMINKRGQGTVQAHYYEHDVTDFDSIPVLFQKITRDLGGLDLIVYTAAAQPPMSPEEYNFAKDRTMIEVNLCGAIAWLNLAAERFERARSGQIVGISSIAAFRGRRQSPVYNASKAGLETYLEGLRNRTSRYGVKVTTIRPGFVETRLLENASKTFWVISPEEAADEIYKAIIRAKQYVFVPSRWQLIVMLIQVIPSFIFRRLNL